MGWFGSSKSKMSPDADATNLQKRGLAAYSAGNFAEAVKLLEPLAVQGDPLAQVALGDMHAHGQGVQQDARRALHYYQSAAQKCLPLAQVRLGLVHAEGFGVPVDYPQALELFTKAADQGFPLAFHYLGLSHEKGRGVSVNASRAARFYRLAAERDVASAQCNLGALYARGEGVSQNVVLAYFLFRLSARGGNELGLRNLGAVASQLTLAQIDEGDALAQGWRQGQNLPERTNQNGSFEVQTNDVWISRFRPLLEISRELSAGDLSTLEAALKSTSSELATTPGSSNDKLWLGFERLGWATAIQPPMELGKIGIKFFRLTEAGRRELPALWNWIVAERIPPSTSGE